MENNYSPEGGDLAIFLEREGVENIKQGPLEMELMKFGEPLGRRLILKYEDLDMENVDGVKVDKKKKDPDGGWESITCFKVTINEIGYSRLKQHNELVSRHALRAHIAI